MHHSQLSLDAIKMLLTACHEGKRITELQPPLPKNFTPGNIKVLDCIEQLQRTGEAPKVSDVANALQVTRPGITRLVSELESIQAVEKFTDAEDKRIVRLRLTPTGRQLYEYYIERYLNWVAAQVTNISAEDIRTTASTISKLYAIMSANKPKLQGEPPTIPVQRGIPHAK